MRSTSTRILGNTSKKLFGRPWQTIFELFSLTPIFLNYPFQRFTTELCRMVTLWQTISEPGPGLILRLPTKRGNRARVRCRKGLRVPVTPWPQAFQVVGPDVRSSRVFTQPRIFLYRSGPNPFMLCSLAPWSGQSCMTSFQVRTQGLKVAINTSVAATSQEEPGNLLV